MERNSFSFQILLQNRIIIMNEIDLLYMETMRIIKAMNAFKIVSLNTQTYFGYNFIQGLDCIF